MLFLQKDEIKYILELKERLAILEAEKYFKRKRKQKKGCHQNRWQK